MMDDSDCLLECPYNKSHRVQKSRMQTHLFKCRKNYPTMELRRCPFNANHDIVPAEFAIHLETCADRGSVQNHLAQTAQERKPVIMPYVAPVLPTEGENWDCDEPVQTYDPTSKNINVKVLRSLQGASKSERKNHRARERLRFNAVAENGGLEGAVGGSVENNNTDLSEQPSSSKHAFEYDQQVREPKTKPKTFATPSSPVGKPKKSPATPPTSPTKDTQSPELGLPRKDAAGGKSPDKAASGAWGNGMAGGSQNAKMARIGSPEKLQAPQQVAAATVKPPVQPTPSNGYKASVNVNTGYGVPAPNLERDFPALGRGRGRLRNNNPN